MLEPRALPRCTGTNSGVVCTESPLSRTLTQLMQCDRMNKNWRRPRANLSSETDRVAKINLHWKKTKKKLHYIKLKTFLANKQKRQAQRVSCLCHTFLHLTNTRADTDAPSTKAETVFLKTVTHTRTHTYHTCTDICSGVPCARRFQNKYIKTTHMHKTQVQPIEVLVCHKQIPSCVQDSGRLGKHGFWVAFFF